MSSRGVCSLVFVLGIEIWVGWDQANYGFRCGVGERVAVLMFGFGLWALGVVIW